MEIKEKGQPLSGRPCMMDILISYRIEDVADEHRGLRAGHEFAGAERAVREPADDVGLGELCDLRLVRLGRDVA